MAANRTCWRIMKIRGLAGFSSFQYAVTLFCGTFLVQSICPIATSFDSRWTVPTALSLIHRGDASLDEYQAVLAQEGYVAAACVPVRGDSPPCRWYSTYPVAVPLVSAPFVAGLEGLLKLAAPALSALGIRPANPRIAAFLQGDLVTAKAIAEMVIGSLFVSMTTVLIFLITRDELGNAAALIPSLVFAFATSAWSTAGRALWQHGPSMLFLSIAIYLILRARKDPPVIQYAGLACAVAYTVRPTNGLAVLVFSLYVVRHYRAWFWRYLLWALPVAILFFLFNLSVYGQPLSPYFSLRPPVPDSAAGWLDIGQALAGNLISPSRGLLIFSPVLVFSIWGMWRAVRTLWMGPFSVYLVVLVCVHGIVISLFVSFWWGGHSYGPRLWCDMLPVLVLFLVPVVRPWQQSENPMRRPAVWLFALAVGFSLFVHSQGALSERVYQWNVDPVNVDQHPERVWDWSDPQFLRGVRR